MNIIKNIKEQFKHDSIIRNLAYYELYYQVSLSKIVRDSEFDAKSTYHKINQLALDIDPEVLFYTVITIIKNHYKESAIDHHYVYRLRKHAAVHALEDYIEKDDDLLNPTVYLELVLEKINEDNFFTEYMEQNVENGFKLSLNRWDDIIVKELSSEIRSRALSIVL